MVTHSYPPGRYLQAPSTRSTFFSIGSTTFSAPAARACVLALATLLLGGCGKPPAPVEPVRAVRVEVVGATARAGAQAYAAEIRARVESRLAFRVGGKLVERSVDAGQTVLARAELDHFGMFTLAVPVGTARLALIDRAGAVVLVIEWPSRSDR